MGEYEGEKETLLPAPAALICSHCQKGPMGPHRERVFPNGTLIKTGSKLIAQG